MKEIGTEEIPQPIPVIEKPKQENPFSAIQIPFEEEKKSAT